ncbi:MAG: outer membrane cobalamin receptor, partial [Oceanicoccus sp.]
MTHLAVNVNARLLNTIAATLLIANSNSNLYAGDSTEASLETVAVTASRVPQPIANSASSLSLVDPFSLTQVSHNHIQQSLSRVAGVWASRGNGQEHLTAIRSPVLTGAGSCGAFSVSEDGIPVRPTGFCNVNQLFDINSEQAGRIEVLRGPGTVLHGSDAMHGVINVISAAPSNQLENQLSLEAGANDYYRSKYSISDRQGRHSYRLSINGSSDGGYKDDSGYDQQKLSLRHDYQGIALSAQTLFSASNLNQETAGYIAGKNAYKEDDRKQQNPNPEAFRDSQAYRLQSQLVKNLDNGGQFIVTPFARYSEMDFLMHFLPGTPLEQNGQKSIG